MANSSNNSTEKNHPEQLLVICLANTGYRRAGLAFVKGENNLSLAELSHEQIAAIKADKRLKVPEPNMVSAPRSLDSSDGATPLILAAAPPQTQLQTKEAISDNEAMSFSEAISLLDKDNPDHFTQGGKPQCTALEGLMAKPFSASERDAAWDEYLSHSSAAIVDDQAEV
ncbi:HI1506-related protein [Shewanella sp.]|uniref:HI1506-related protein n=1 Tax=Shewanella sp. TaxID=50422 RepID=UPI0040541AF8